jgi:DNA invertase Pin-like site-specific DNA recombinase
LNAKAWRTPWRSSGKADTLVVWKLDRLGRSLQDLIATLNGLQGHGVDFISLPENIDTTTPGGKLIFT